MPLTQRDVATGDIARGMSARKKCTRCGQTKALEKFNRNRRAKDGRRPNCKACQRGYDARWYAENRERQREYDARWYAENKDNPEYRDRDRERAARWYAENKDNPEYRERRRARAARRRARKRGLPDDGSGIADWLSHMEESDVWHCHLAGELSRPVMTSTGTIATLFRPVRPERCCRTWRPPMTRATYPVATPRCVSGISA